MAFRSISASVGKHNNGQTNCYNHLPDQSTIIGLLNSIPAANGGTAGDRNRLLSLPYELKPPTCAPGLYDAIRAFQSRQNMLGMRPLLSVDGHVDPGGATLQRLNGLADDTLIVLAPIPSPHSAAPVPPAPTPQTLTLSGTDWDFLDLTEVSLALGPVRIGSGQIQVRNAENVIGLNFASAGIQAGVSPIPGVPDSAFGTFVRGNLSSFLKLFFSPQAHPFKVGDIFKNPLNVAGDLKLRDLTTGLMVVLKGETGVVINGTQVSLVFFGVPFFQGLSGVFLPAAPFAILEALGRLLLEGKFPLPNAVGTFAKTSPGIAGASVSGSTAWITNAQLQGFSRNAGRR
jgi:hypothetical protein